MKEIGDQVIAPLTEYMHSKASYLRIPISGTFELSPVCNFSCRMCYVRKTQKEVDIHVRKQMTLAEWRKVAREAYDAGMLYILLTGGEPLLWPDFWTLYEELYQMGFLLSINTNGALIDEAAVEKFRKMPPRRINITLYGANDETYEALCQVKNVFSKVDNAIMSLKAAGITVKLNASFTPYNIGDMEALVEYAEQRELILDTSSYMFPPIRRDKSMVGKNERFTPEEAAECRMKCFRLQNGEERYQQYLSRIRNGWVDPPGLEDGCLDPIDGKIRCRAGKAAFWVTWDGWITPCGMMNEPRVDVREKCFAKNWKELVRMTSEVKTSGKCNSCENQRICHACAAMAITETGSSAGVPTYLCEMSKEMKRIADMHEK